MVPCKARDMAKRSRSERRAQKARIAARSHQARINEAARNVTDLHTYNPNTVGKLTDRQLQTLAASLGEQQEMAKRAAVAKAGERFYNVPQIKITQRDRMYAQRPPISDAEIEAAPSKQRKLLRQQQKRRQAARDRILEAHDNERLLRKRTIMQQRAREWSGEDIEETGLPDRVLQGDPDVRRLLLTENVLKDHEFVAEMDRKQLEKEVLDAAERVGKKRKRDDEKKPEKVRKKQRRGAHGTKKWNRYISNQNYHKLRDAFGNDLAAMYQGMTDKQRYFLENATNFATLLARVIVSELQKMGRKARTIWRFATDSGEQKSEVAQQLREFMIMAKRYA